MFIKKIIKLFFIIFLLFISFVIIEMVSISTKYINRALITLDVNNVRNPQIKKLVRTIDNLYTLGLLKISNEQKNHLYQTDLKYKHEKCEIDELLPEMIKKS